MPLTSQARGLASAKASAKLADLRREGGPPPRLGPAPSIRRGVSSLIFSVSSSSSSASSFFPRGLVLCYNRASRPPWDSGFPNALAALPGSRWRVLLLDGGFYASADWFGTGTMLCAVLLLVAVPVSAQEFRGAITGRAADPSGGRLPGVTVTATNTATNVASTTTTNREGEFSFPLLNPGMYTVTAELTGFRKLIRPGIEVRVADRIGLDLTLEVGEMSETVSVVADSPLLETQSGSTGQVIDQKTISMMPLSDGNPFVLTRLAPGIAYNGDLKFSRPFDNGGTSGIVTGGATGGNEFTLDGSPNMANGRRVAFVPPSDAVQQFKVETASFDAASGHTGGGTVNVTLKSGTNRCADRATCTTDPRSSPTRISS